MSLVEEQYKEKLKELETILEDPSTNDWQRENILKRIEEYKHKIEIISTMELDKASADMKAILSHTHAIEDKYQCRSVKFMFRVADFVEKYISIGLGKKIASYAVNKIHAPVCSIVAGSKPELPPMPKHGTKEEFERLDRQRRERAELLKWREISLNLLEKPPTFKENLTIKYNKFIRKLLPKESEIN